MNLRFAFCRIVPAALLCWISVGTMTGGDSPKASPRPNVLLIVADDMGFSDAGCYGGEIATPNLDGLAANGLRFTQFYNTARCWPTRGALLTGYYAQQIRRDTVPGVRSGGAGTRPAWAPLLPERLRPLGYRSYHSGKWHIDGPRLKGGFDRSYSIEDHNRFFSPQRHLEDDRKLPPVEPGTDYYVTTAIADHAIRCLQEHAREHADKPFFHYLCFTAPHFPLQAPAQDIARYAHRYDVGWDVVRETRWKRLVKLGVVNHPLPPLERDVGPPYHFPDALKQLGPDEVNRPLDWDELTTTQQRFQADKMSIHAAMIDRMDREIGRVLAQLRAMGAFRNTLILFLSDNGASAEIMVRGDGHDPEAPPGSAGSYLCLGPGWSSAANTPHRRHKTWVHEGGIATPLIAHWPEGIAARGAWRRTPAHVIDLAPTILELAGGTWTESWNSTPAPPPPGRSLISVLKGDDSPLHDSLWWLHEGNRAIRVGDWKLVAAGEQGPWELYNLSVDRGETHDLASEQPERVNDLQSLWQSQWDQIQRLATADELDQKIDTLRKGTLTIEAPPGTEVRVEQLRHEFWFGAALANSVFNGRLNAEDTARYQETFLTNFNAAVTENALKWHDMERRRGQVNYATVDAILAWTEEHKIPLRGHNIFWGIPNRVQPWLKELGDDALRETLRVRALDVGRRYRGRFAEYDLNNEMLHANYYEDRLGALITRDMAAWVREGDPDATLYLNDYDILTGNRLDDFVAHVRRFQEQGIRFDGIGVQGHLHGDSFNPEALRSALEKLAAIDLPIRITEFNFPGQRSKHYRQRGAQLTEAEEQAKAEALVEYFKICFATPRVEGILFWGFWEGANWIPVSSLYRRDWTPTPAAKAYRNLVYDEWWTRWQGRTGGNGRCKVRAFYGTHRVTAGDKTVTVTLRKADRTAQVTLR